MRSELAPAPLLQGYTPPSAARLRSAQRLHSGSAIQQVLAKRQVLRGSFFNLHWSQAAQSCLGLIVAKRLAGDAVRRNTVKRLCREQFRLQVAKLRPLHLVLRLTTALPRSGERLEPGSSLRRALNQDLQNLLRQQRLGTTVSTS